MTDSEFCSNCGTEEDYLMLCDYCMAPLCYDCEARDRHGCNDPEEEEES